MLRFLLYDNVECWYYEAGMFHCGLGCSLGTSAYVILAIYNPNGTYNFLIQLCLTLEI